MRKKIIIGNWKMKPPSRIEVLKLLKSTGSFINLIKKSEVVICPPFVYLESFRELNKKIKLGAQNVASFKEGSYTGEISIDMLKSFNVKYVILGHSERRAQGESDSEVNKKIKLALSSNIVPILCIGEKERDENHEYVNFIKNQLEESLKGVSKGDINKLIIAYEPVWAIGRDAKREASANECREVVILIKKILSDKFGIKNISNVRIIYGGSVSPNNVLGFLKEGDVDGFLVGRDSLNKEKFSEIIKVTENFF